MLWNSNYETGNKLVDSEHKEIFGMVKNLFPASWRGLTIAPIYCTDLPNKTAPICLTR